MTERVRVETQSAAGMLWLASWLFTLGYLDLSFWRGVLAILLWPYFLGVALGAVANG